MATIEQCRFRPGLVLSVPTTFHLRLELPVQVVRALGRCTVIALCAAMPQVATGVEPTSADPSMVELDRVGRRIAQDQCARPQSVDIRPASSAHGSTPNGQIRTYAAAGCRIVLYRARAARSQAAVPLEVELHGDHRRLMPAIAVGATTASVLTALGVPYRMQGDNMVYALSDDEPDKAFVTLKIKDGKVESLAWKWQVDQARDRTRP